MERGFGYDLDNGCGYVAWLKDEETKCEALLPLISKGDCIIDTSPIFCGETKTEVFDKIQRFEVDRDNDASSSDYESSESIE
jgi:hypothetical protein